MYVVANGLGAIYFYFNPSDFYFRAWEYFEEVVYPFDNIDPVWNRNETSDQTRKHFFYYQDSHKTLVTVDGDGFRSVPFKVASYPIMISGQSMIFGSGLSDNETMPWVLSKKLKIPIFNGGRSSVYNVLKNKKLTNVKLVIQCKPERVLTSSLYRADFKNRDMKYIPLRKYHNKNIFSFLRRIPSDRYLVTSVVRRKVLRAWNDMDIFLGKEKVKDFFFANYQLHKTDLFGSVAAIIRQRDEIEGKGMQYIFTAIPSKKTLYANGVDAFNLKYLELLHDLLDQAGVKNIRLYPQFIEHKDDMLYRRYDTHWNPKGVKLAASVIADYLKKNVINVSYGEYVK